MIVVVVATEVEGRPWVDTHRLRRRSAAWPWFEGDGMALVVSGIGRERAAAAVGFAAARLEGEAVGWLNFGIAGHPTLEQGEVRWVDRVEGPVGKPFYPVSGRRLTLATAGLRTVDRPEREFPAPVLYDMEGSAFAATASRIAPLELVHLLKVVSDNRTTTMPVTPKGRPDPAVLGSWLERACEAGGRVVEELLRSRIRRLLERRLSAEALDFAGDRRLTVTQRRQLHRLLERHLALEGRLPDPDPTREANVWLAGLERQVERSARASGGSHDPTAAP